MRKRRAVLLLLVLLCVTASGCARQKYVRELNKRLTSLEAVSKLPPNATYTVDPPDIIRIEFLNQPELTREVELRSDGMVTLPYLEDVEVGGMTTVEIREKLEDLYAAYYKEPRILVSVASFRSKHLYVYGEVGSEGTQSYTGYQHISDVIGQAGGVTRRAAPGRVKVIRGDPEDPEVYKVDLDALLFEGDRLQDVSLAENDVVYVPPNRLAWVGYQMDNLLFPFRGVLSVLSTVRNVQGPD
ncbi:MAG: polysaccharide biosynthesis/export family protein [Planctomycetota bacterium]